jgi:hypothetical protein
MVLAIGVCALMASSALAHHSFAMFDFNKVTKAHAVVQEFRWTNPHVVLVIKVESGEVPAGKLWSLELTSPGNLTRTGWNRKAFSPGDVIDIEFNPMRDGRQGGAFRKSTNTSTGQVWETNLRAQEKPGLE